MKKDRRRKNLQIAFISYLLTSAITTVPAQAAPRCESIFDISRSAEVVIVEEVTETPLSLRVSERNILESKERANDYLNTLVEISSSPELTTLQMHEQAVRALTPIYGLNKEISVRLEQMTVEAFDMMTKKDVTKFDPESKVAYDPIKDPLAVIQKFRYKLDKLTENLDGLGGKLTKPTLYARLAKIPFLGNTMMKKDSQKKQQYVDEVLTFNDEVAAQAIELSNVSKLLREEISSLESLDIQLSQRILQLSNLEYRIHETLPQLDRFSQEKVQKVMLPLLSQIKNEQLGLLVSIRANTQAFETTADILPELSKLSSRILHTTVPTIAALTRAGVISNEVKQVSKSIHGLKKSNDNAINDLGRTLESTYNSYINSATKSVVSESTVAQFSERLQRVREGLDASGLKIESTLSSANAKLMQQMQLAHEIIPAQGVSATEVGLLRQIKKILMR